MPVLLTPDVSVWSDQEVERALSPLPSRPKRAALAMMTLLGAGVLSGLGAGAAGLGTSFQFCYKLFQELNEDMDRVADSLLSLRSQITSLAAVALQNQRALDLFTAQRGGARAPGGEECCYYVNESGW